MRVGIVGLGKLGLPVALTLEQAGHEIFGWDASAERLEQIRTYSVPEAAHEPHLGEYLAQSRLLLEPHLSLARPDIVLVCVQTPHQPEFEGVTPLDRPPEDFDYTWLRAAVADLANEIRCADGWDPLVVVVSTCLPGTFDRYLRPLLDAGRSTDPHWRYRAIRFAYMPLFIAMGSVIEDFRDPEFILVGTDDREYGGVELPDMYAPILDGRPARFRVMSITSAELTKVAYNAFLGFKLMLANGVAMTCDAVGANADDVMGTLKLATKRLVSTAYLTPGMGDGGGCHPRDQIALSWLARELELLHDPYRAVVDHREAHARWLAEIWTAEAEAFELERIMLGRAYKPNSTLATGSHARLVEHYANLLGGLPVLASDRPILEGRYPVACYLLATPHDHFLTAELPSGSVLIDPWGAFPEREGLRIIRPGRRA